ncbi:hypothetical protein BDV12DRAFT_201636 [Aspergillus spectabilis]
MSSQEPSIKFRGMFINDESPSLTGLVIGKFGKYNKEFNTHVFDLLLRLKVNFLWPAMWLGYPASKFFTDDPENQSTADAYELLALYKEVQEYWDAGRIDLPDDVTLLSADDNFGSLRRLPSSSEADRKGGAGIYYHFEYVGVPRSYKWLNSNSIGKTWHQLQEAYRRHARQIWIFNVGDIKPMEIPFTLAMSLAWDIDSVTADSIPHFYKAMAEQVFGAELARPVSSIWGEYHRLVAIRRQEHIDTDTFSLLHYDEATKILSQWRNLLRTAQSLDTQRRSIFRSESGWLRTCSGQAKDYEILRLPVINRAIDTSTAFEGYVESDDVVSIPATQPTSGTEGYLIHPAAGRIPEGLISAQPAKLDSVAAGDLPFLSYSGYVFKYHSEATLHLDFNMTLDLDPGVPMQYELGIDDGPFEKHRLVEDASQPGELPPGWRAAVMDLVWARKHALKDLRPGKHTLNIRLLHSNIMLEKLLLNLGGLKPSYLGPPTSFRHTCK